MFPQPPAIAIEPISQFRDIPENSSKAQILEIITENNIKSQEAVDKLIAWQSWYKQVEEISNGKTD